MKALDLSFSSASIAWCQAQKVAGWALLIQNLWTGVSTPSPARANLANAWQAGMLTAGYTVVNNLSGVTAINKAATAAGPEWAHLAFVSVDVEVTTTAAIVREAVDGLRAQGKKVCIYTGGWFWNRFNLAGHDFSDVPCWLADYDGNSAMDTAPLAKLGPVIGKQYKNSHDLGGVTVDANTFNASFIQEESDMPKMRFVKAPTGPEWVTNGVFKMGITDDQIKTDLVNLGLAEPGTLTVAQVFVDWLIDYPKDMGGLNTRMDALAASADADLAAIAKAVNDELARRQQE